MFLRSNSRSKRLQERLEGLGEDAGNGRAIGRLDGLEVSSPPGSCSPPGSTNPDTRLLHRAESTLDGSDTDIVGASTDLTEEALEVVRLEPGGSISQALGTNSRGDTLVGGTRTIGVEVLMHLDGEVVVGILESSEVLSVACAGPCPGSCPGSTFGEDELAGSTGGTDTVDGGLVEVEDCAGVNAIRLVHDVKDDLAVRLEQGSKALPPGLEVRGAADDLVVVAHVVVRIDDCVCTLASDIADNGLEATQVSSVEASIETGGDRRHAFHQEWNTEGVESLADKVVDGRRCWPGVVLVQLAWDGGRAKFSSRFADTEELELGRIGACSVAWTTRCR